MQTHEHLHRDAKLRSAQKGRLFQRFSFGPGGPTVTILTLRLFKAMVLGDSCLLGQFGAAPDLTGTWKGALAPD